MVPKKYSSAKSWILVVLILLMGCDLSQHTQQSKEFCTAITKMRQSYDSLYKNNPCGVLQVQNPLFNVSGRMTFVGEDTSEIFLFIAPNTTMESAFYVVENCAPIERRPLNASGYFTFDSLPVGKYVAAVRNPVHIRTQGFPIIDEFSESGYTLTLNEYGGNSMHSLAIFSLDSTS